MAILALHKATVGTAPAAKTYYFYANPDSYTGLAAETGVDKADDAESDEPAIKVDQLLGKGVLVRVNVRYLESGKYRVGRLLVTRGKVGTALEDLEDKAFRGGTIKSANIPRRATMY